LGDEILEDKCELEVLEPSKNTGSTIGDERDKFAIRNCQNSRAIY
jgi:hypothetical protein